MRSIDLLLAAVVLLPPASLHAADGPHILLYEALQFENIGDQGRAVGAVRLIYRHLPNATVTLWPIRLHEVREQQMLQRAFPKLRIARGELTPTGEPATAELADAWRAADICVFATRQKAQSEAWAKTGKPYGYISAQFDPVSLYTPDSAVGTLDQLRASIVVLPPDHLDVAYKPPKAFAKGDPRIIRLFPDYEAREQEYARGRMLEPIDPEAGPPPAMDPASRGVGNNRTR